MRENSKSDFHKCRYKMNFESKIRLFSIYYNDETFNAIPAGFEGLCNFDGPCHLYEIFPIYKFLSQNRLLKDEWLGFFSPKFSQKTKITAKDIINSVNIANSATKACLFSSHFDLASLFPNVWIQGESHHPGLMKLSQTLAQKAGYKIDLARSITCLNSSVFSHYLVAKVDFWREWERIVSIYFEMVKSGDALSTYSTLHAGKQTLIHAFVIERVPSMILKQQSYKAFFDIELYDRQVSIATSQGKDLVKLNEYKRIYLETHDYKWLNLYAGLARKYTYEQFKSSTDNTRQEIDTL